MTKTVEIKGDIIPNDYADIYDYMNYEYVSPKEINQTLNEANGEPIVFKINSGGGYIDAGSEMYTAIKDYSGKTTSEIVGYACSSASWIALASDVIKISPTGQFMIHRVSSSAKGNADDFSQALQSVNSMDRALIDVYAQKTGLDKQDIYRLMCDQTWLNAKDAVDKGFADEIMFQNQPALVNAEGDLALNPDMINKMKNLIHKPKPSSDDDKPTEINKVDKRKLTKNKLSFLFGKEM